MNKKHNTMKEKFQVVRWRRAGKNKKRLMSKMEYESEDLKAVRSVAQGLYIQEVIKSLGINPHRLNINIWSAKFNKETAPQIKDVLFSILKVSESNQKEYLDGYGDETIRTYPRIKKSVE